VAQGKSGNFRPDFRTSVYPQEHRKAVNHEVPCQKEEFPLGDLEAKNFIHLRPKND
jgi:hypothetical protein